MRPLTGYRRKPWGLGVHAPARGQDHKWGTHTLPSNERQGSPRNHSSPRDPPYQWGRVLHDADMAEAILDRVLERGQVLHFKGPSFRTRHQRAKEGARVSGTHRLAFTAYALWTEGVLSEKTAVKLYSAKGRRLAKRAEEPVEVLSLAGAGDKLMGQLGRGGGTQSPSLTSEDPAIRFRERA